MRMIDLKVLKRSDGWFKMLVDNVTSSTCDNLSQTNRYSVVSHS